MKEGYLDFDEYIQQGEPNLTPSASIPQEPEQDPEQVPEQVATPDRNIC